MQLINSPPVSSTDRNSLPHLQVISVEYWGQTVHLFMCGTLEVTLHYFLKQKRNFEYHIYHVYYLNRSTVLNNKKKIKEIMYFQFDPILVL